MKQLVYILFFIFFTVKNGRIINYAVSLRILLTSFRNVLTGYSYSSTLYHQKPTTGIMNFLNQDFKQHHKIHLKIVSVILISSVFLSLLTYLFLRVLFFDFSIPIREEVINLSKTLLTGVGIGLLIYFLFILTGVIETLLRDWRKMRPVIKFVLPLMIIALIVLASACSERIKVGIKKDLSTGLVSDYSDMEPGKVMLVMNDEVLNHADIPIGEKFMLINDNISGMKTIDGKVSVGCSLMITDTTGKTIFKDDDLFKENSSFYEKDAKMLKCTVSTGLPMEAEEYYNVYVKFWDKKGKGSITNKVTIHMIDMP